MTATSKVLSRHMDQLFVERLLRHEAAAWREFHTRYNRLVYRSIHRVTRRFSAVLGSEDVEEIYANFLVNLHKRGMHKLRSYSPERGCSLSTWISLLATNTAWDFLRGVARQPAPASLCETAELRSVSPDPHRQLEARERLTALQRTLIKLSDRDRRFVQLFFVEGRSPEQIAEDMSISVKTVYSKKHKIRCRLQSAMEPAAA